MKNHLQSTKLFALILAITVVTLGAKAQGGCSTTEINFNDYNFNSYGGNQDATGTVSVTPDGSEAFFANNAWKSIDFPVEINLGTVLEFEFKSDRKGERHGIGFDNDNNLDVGGDLPQFFQVFGDETTGTFNNYNNYTTTGQWLSYSIPVGQILSGNYSKLVFMSDDDGGAPLGNSYFRNIRFVEGEGAPCTLANGFEGIVEDCECVEIPACPIINFDDYFISPFDPQNQDEGEYTVIEGGEGLMIVENAWKAIDFSYNLTPNSILEFEFKSTAQGEIHGIGLDSDNLLTQNRVFRVYGTQNYGRGNYANYNGNEGQWVEYVIPIGTFSDNTGARSRLFFAGDDDDAPQDANSYFRSVRVYEEGSCNPDCIPPQIMACEGPVTAVAGPDCLAEVEFSVMAEGTNLTYSYQYLGQPISSPATFPAGAHHIIATVTNECGSAMSECLMIQVTDQTAPSALAKDIEVELGSDGTATITAQDVDNGSSDSCGDVELSIDIDSFDCLDLGENEVTLSVTDEAGLEATAIATVNVVDNELPTASALGFTVELDVNGAASITAEDVDNGSSDNCGIVSKSLDVMSFSCANIGENTVTLTVEDASGNEASAEATIVVEDNVSPIASALGFTVQLDASGAASISADDVDSGSSDNCGIVSKSLDISSFSCANIGENTVTLTVEDASGNEASAEATILVEDNVNPIASALGFTVQLDASGAASISADEVDSGSSDNCGIVSKSLNVMSFSCANIGANTVTLTVEDASGNEASAEATIVVEDNVSPIASALGFTVQLDASGAASISADDVDSGSSDNCGIVSKSLDISSFSCANIGANTVTLTVADDSGNEASAEATIVVEDNVSPIASALGFTVQLDASGAASISADDVDSGSSDNCGIVSKSLDVMSFSCANIGENTVTLTVEDASGNEASAEATIVVEDNIDPIALAQGFTIQLNAAGEASITAEEVDNGSSDACGIASLELSQYDFDCSHVGANTVTLFVTDVNGNQATAEATITVEDNEDPSASALGFTVQLDNSGLASITAEEVDNGSSDACGIASLELSQYNFDCGDEGDNEITLSVEDVNGNVSTATAIISVLAPVEGPQALISADVELTEENSNAVIFDNAPSSAGLDNQVTLTASFDAGAYVAAAHQWFVRDLPDGSFAPIDGANSATLIIDADDDFQRAYKVEITSSSSCVAEAIQDVYSVDTSCKNANKVLVCMVPPGNPDNAHEICVNVNALDALLSNTDSYVGTCDIDYKINETPEAEVSIFPNPTTGMVSINYKASRDSKVRMEIYNITGQLVEVLYEGNVVGELTFTQRYDFQSWENGIYLVRIIEGDSVQSKRIILSK